MSLKLAFAAGIAVPMSACVERTEDRNHWRALTSGLGVGANHNGSQARMRNFADAATNDRTFRLRHRATLDPVHAELARTFIHSQMLSRTADARQSGRLCADVGCTCTRRASQVPHVGR